jgi:hypothetical protein
LHGQTGTRGAANFYELNGTIEVNGTATLRAKGITGNPKQTPFYKHGTPFEYQAVKLARKVLDQAEKDPYRVLGFTIIEAAIRCLERIKPFFLPGKAKTEAHLTEFYVFNEFLYFFLHMSNRAAFSEGFNEQERNAFLEKLFPVLIATVIDLFAEDLPEEIKGRIRGEFYDNVHFAETGYSTSKELVSKEYKPLSGDSLLAKLSRNVVAKTDKEYNPEALTQVTVAAFEELKKADIPKLVAAIRTALRDQLKD